MDDALIMRRLPRLAAGLVMTLAGLGAAAQISPGELSRPHAALDTSDRCLDCHSSKRGVDAARCFSCHGALRQRAEREKGLHGRADFRACERCHIEHQGRAFDLIYWGDGGPEAFDHARSGWPLEGAHSSLGCRDCHRQERLKDEAKLAAEGAPARSTFLGLETSCVSCHRDPHEGRLGAATCAHCHTQAAWKPAAGFDHAATEFPLTGRHQGLSCERCHGAEKTAGASSPVRFGELPTACASCHADPHARRFGTRCESCHETAGWERIDRAGFDHGKTAYPLLGKHAAVACASCHRPGRPMRLPAFDRCTSCHADTHAGQLKAGDGTTDCARCHTVEGFRPARFTAADHDRTAYPLAGAHRDVGCAKCHAAVAPGELEQGGVPLSFAGSRPAKLMRFRFGSTACPSCHADPHRGQVGAFLGEPGCASCHSQKTWREVTFEHSRTDFALLGAHLRLACERCHRTPPGSTGALATARTMRFDGVARECAGCHADPHLGQFLLGPAPRACEGCHGNETWVPAGFDHARDTAFALEGAHRAAACVACHPSALVAGRAVSRYRGVSRACVACHSKEVPGG